MSTGTRKALAEINCPDRFEALATEVLRAGNRLYANIAHVGTNADGRAVRSPVDGIAVSYSKTTRHLILAHHTITKRKDLRSKWLDPKDGDIAKALRIARAERDRRTISEARLVLTTPFEPGEDLIRDAHALAGDGLRLDMWTGSRLAGFLDRDPEGQWIRAAYFQADQTRLSPSKLRAICELSLNSFLPHDDPELAVPRSVDDDLFAFCGNLSGTGFVVGGSGFGKSTAVRQLAVAELDRGGYALVIPHHVAEQAPSLEQALATTLLSWAPALESSCGRDALGLASPEQPILLLVEDVNRSANPIELVERLLGWTPTGKEGSPLNWRLLVPVWQANVAVAEKARQAIAARSMFVERFDRAEAAAAVSARAASSGRMLTPLQAEDLAARLGDDPLLIALNRDWHEPSAEHAIDSYIAQETRNAAESSLLPADIRDALETLAEQLVLERRLDPSWAEIKHWLGSDSTELAAVRALLRNAHIVRLDESAGVERLAYRHDRLRDHLLSRAIERLIGRKELPDEHWSDPYFAGLIGAVLTRLDDEAVAKTALLNPPALFAALQDQELEQPRVEQILALAREWIGSERFSAESSEEQKFHALRYLARTDAPFVIELASNFPKSFPKLEAMIRNDDVRAAAAYCFSSGPGVQNRWRDRLIDHAIERHPGFVAALGQLIEQEGSVDLLEGALNLAGEIGDRSLSHSLTRRWEQGAAQGRSLTTGWLWAVIRCCPGQPLADELCRLWAALPDQVKRKDDRDSNPRWDIAGFELPWGFRRKPEPGAIAYLISLARRERRLLNPLLTILSKVDRPDAIVWSIEQCAKIARRCARTGGINLFRNDLERAWNPDHHGQRLSEPSRRAAERIWRDRRRNAFARHAAFGLWSQSTSTDEIASLAELEEDPVLADAALRARLRAGDQSAIPLLKARIAAAERPIYWWQHARRVGLTGLQDEVERFMRERRANPPSSPHTNADYIMSELLMDQRDAFAISILKDNWAHLKSSPRYIQAALYTADPELVALAHAEIESSANPDAIFEHISMGWGLKTFGRPGTVEIKQLEALEPYYHRFDKMRLMSFFEAANALGALKWRKRHIDPHLVTGHRGICAGTREALFASLDAEIARASEHRMRWFGIDHWFKRREEEHWDRDEVLRAAADWAAERGTEDAARLLAEAVQYFGRRSTLELLDRLALAVQLALADTLENTRYAVRARSLS